MKKIKNIKPGKNTILASLYVSQMLGVSFLVNSLPSILRETGVNLEKMGWIYGLGMIWALNFLWAPLIDRFGFKKLGHYRGWIILCQSMIVIFLTIMAFLDLKTDFSILLYLFILIPFFSATQDIATDALAVNILSSKERVSGNAVQISGNLAGSMVGGGILLITYSWFGWSYSILILALLSSIPLFTILPYKEKKDSHEKSSQETYKHIVDYFKKPGITSWIFILIFFGISTKIVYGITGPFLVDYGWSLYKIGLFINIIGPVTGILGTFICSYFVEKFNKRKVFLFSILITIVGITCLSLLPQNKIPGYFTYISIFFIMFSFGLGSPIILAAAMDRSDIKSAGTDFSVQMAISKIPAFMFGGVLMSFIDRIGYSLLFTGLTIFPFLCMIIVYFYVDDELRAIKKTAEILEY